MRELFYRKSQYTAECIFCGHLGSAGGVTVLSSISISIDSCCGIKSEVETPAQFFFELGYCFSFDYEELEEW